MANRDAMRSLGAILAIDAVGYSRQMGHDEEATLATLQAYRALIAERVAHRGGRVFGVAGDSAMAVLPGAVEALSCALDIQSAVEAINAELPEARRMPLRLGIHFGTLRTEGEGVYGDDVNIAARVESLAGAGGICLSGAVFERVEGKLALGYEAYGPQRLKNIDRPISVYRVRDEPEMVGRVVPGKPPRTRSPWRVVALAASIALLAAGAWGAYQQVQVAEVERLAAERTERLRLSLESAEDRAAGERLRTGELLVALKQAAEQSDAARAGAAERTVVLASELQSAEARAAAERRRAETLLSELRELESEIQASAAVAERRRIEALVAGWRIAERQALAEGDRVAGLIEDLAVAERRAAARAEAARGQAEARQRAGELVTRLAAAERQAAAEIEKGEALLAELREGADAATRARVEDLLADLTAAGSSAATERKRAELMLASWVAPVTEDQAVPDPGARARAEALLAELGAAGRNAGAERQRAEDLLAKLIAAQAEALARRRSVELQRVKQMMSTVKGWAEPASVESEVETVAPSPEPPESNAAPTAPEQLAALPDQAVASDAARQAPDDEAALEAVERLLRERRDAFRGNLQTYLNRQGLFGGSEVSPIGVNRVLEAEVLAVDGDAYRLRVLFQGVPPLGTGGNKAMLSERVTVIVTINGADLEIIGHEAPSGEGRGQAAATASPADLAAAERFLRERRVEFRKALIRRLRRDLPDGGIECGFRSSLVNLEVVAAAANRFTVGVFLDKGYKTYTCEGYVLAQVALKGDEFEILSVEHDSTAKLKRSSESATQAAVTSGQQAEFEAVERLLRERDDEFRAKLRAYNLRHEVLSTSWVGNTAFYLVHKIEVLGTRDGEYSVRVTLDPDRTTAWDGGGIVDLILFLKFDGEDFEIVGHGGPGAPGTQRVDRSALAPD